MRTSRAPVAGGVRRAPLPFLAERDAQRARHRVPGQGEAAIIERYRFGLLPIEPEAKARVHALVAALGASLDATIELHQAANYRALVAALREGLVHFAWLPPLSAALAKREHSITPVAISVRSGASSVMTALFTLRSSKIVSLADLQWVRVAWVDRDSASGYAVVRHALRSAGVVLTDAFRDELFVRSHAEVRRAVKDGRADVGATCFHAEGGRLRIATSGHEVNIGLDDDEVRLLCEAGPIPADIFAAHRSVPPRVIAAIDKALVHAGAPGALKARAMVVMRADDFARPTEAHMRMLDTLYETIIAPRSNPPPRSHPPTRPPTR